MAIGYSTLGFLDRDLVSALEIIAAVGFDQVEILGQEPHLAVLPRGRNLSEFNKRLSLYRLSVSVHAPMTTNVLGAPEEQWRREKVGVLAEYLHFSGAIGAKYMVMHPIPNPMFVPNPDDPRLPQLMLDAVRRSLDELVNIAEQTGTRILLENLPYDCDYPLRTLAELRAAIADYPPRAVGLLIDTGHAQISGACPADEIMAAGDRLHGTHLHDNDGKDDQHFIPGKGVIDWPAVRSALRRAHYTGPLTFELTTCTDSESSEELCRKALAVGKRWQKEDDAPGSDMPATRGE